MRPATIEQRRRLYLLARVVIARHYRRPLTLDEVARALSSSPRQLTRAYAQFGETTFREDLLTRRLKVAAQLLIEQPAISVGDVARLVGFRQAPHFAKAFRRRYGLTPAAFRAEGRAFTRAAREQNMAPRGSEQADVPQRVSNAPRATQCRALPATRPVPLPVGAGASACRPPERPRR
jgi:AraC family transcriptional regulator, regulatory protein of adaptative response / methylphosphotriester-DNA alkyltransferase methyltransferase